MIQQSQSRATATVQTWYTEAEVLHADRLWSDRSGPSCPKIVLYSKNCVMWENVKSCAA